MTPRLAYPKESNRPITEEVISIAINALEEIQQYKELGTVEELMVAKEKLMGENQNSSVKLQMDELSNTNEKLLRRNKELEARVDELLAKNQKLMKQNTANDDGIDDLEDELEDAKKLNKKLNAEKESLASEIHELKKSLASAEAEIASLKK